eukprot:5090319-Amphidinium_carterae.1
MSGPQGSQTHGFDSELEDWSFYLKRRTTLKSSSERVSKAKLSLRKTTTGRRRARRVGSARPRSRLPTVEEEKACDAFLERISFDQLDDFERHGLDKTDHLHAHSESSAGSTLLSEPTVALVDPGGTRIPRSMQ